MTQFFLPQHSVPVRYAYLHCVLGKEKEEQRQQPTTKQEVPNLF
jgi:hypothetical protein